ncbi:MAG: GNAT family N-acetyltransferase [Bryobacteraceae bacterium]
MAGSQAVIEIRRLHRFNEFEDAVRLQQTIWGFADMEMLPMRSFVVSGNVGGQLFGAYDGGEMVGFLIAVPGIKPGPRAYLHSHMLGVLPAWRDAGIGRLLKLRQREEALERGIELIEWTFDPLELKNAFFNIERLGAIVRRYSENHYGVSDSPLHGGLPTDRLIAEWWLDSPRVRAVLAGEAMARSVQERIVYPADMARIRSEDPGGAREIQRTNGEKFQRAFGRGMAVTGFERGETEGTYLLEPWP